MPLPSPTPIADNTHQYVAMRVIAFCAAYVDTNFDPSKQPPINTDELIAAACKQFGVRGLEMQETYAMREGYL